MTDFPGADTSSEVSRWLEHFQNRLCDQLTELDGGTPFENDHWSRDGYGRGNTRTLSGGALFEKAGVAFSHVNGAHLPPAATEKRPELAGCGFEAMGVSLVLHPNNPFVPTTHANVRFFQARREDTTQAWWFGGGFDLTPYYGFAEDCISWHRAAHDALAPHGQTLYPEFKAWCDRYFYLKHRDECRGIGGLFFDDFNGEGFTHAYGVMQAVANAFQPAYAEIVQRRRDFSYEQAHKDWQAIRRGRYVEFNLVYDRGTLFGLQFGGRTESILLSMPPQVAWAYQHQPEPGSAEARLLSEYLPPRDWLDFKP